MSLRYAVLIALIYFVFLLCNCGSIRPIKTYYNPEVNCNSSRKFDCNVNGTASLFCIDRDKYACNGVPDCPNGSDEEDKLCSNVTCSSDHFMCDKHRCISKEWLCDLVFDCDDKTDEGEFCRTLKCPADNFKCKKSGKCIPLSFLCDSETDCGNGDSSDEQNCTYPPCKEGLEFRCQNQKCISLDLVCDGDRDCSDGSDELQPDSNCSSIYPFSPASESKRPPVVANKTQLRVCHQDEFQCKVQPECIPMVYRCNNKDDCYDKSDEENCTTIQNVTEQAANLNCQWPAKQCVDIKTNLTVCLGVDKFCDNHVDCFKAIDEGGLCAEDLCFNSNCSYKCHNTPSGAACFCPDEHTLAPDNHSCIEKKSTCDFGRCSQICVPLKNSVKCDCHKNFILESDGFSCKSVDASPASIIFSNRHEIRSLDLHTMAQRPLVSGLKNTIALDFFHSTDDSGDLIFFTDIVDDKIYRGSIIQGSLINIQVIVETGLSTAEGLACDYIGQSIYWIESQLDQIEVAKFNGSFRKTLIAGNMESPRSIAVDPRYRILFWTDWQVLHPRIESASMSGEDRKIIYNMTTKETWPNGLTLDLDTQRIYYVDARSDSIQTITYEGTDHREILRNHDLITHPFAISVYSNYLYFTDWKTNSVIKANKFNGSEIRVMQKAMTQPFDIKVYHPSRQPGLNFTHPCTQNNGGCSHLCLLSKRYMFKCECPHIMKLDKDNRTCVPNEKILLFARPNEIRGVDLENIHYHIIPPISLPRVISTYSVDYRAAQKQIYWADSESNELKRSNLNSSVVDVIIDTVIENPFGFALDWISGNLFITSQETKPKIYVCNSNGEYIHTVISQNLSKPYSIAVDPFEGTVFYTDYGSESLEPIVHPHVGFVKMDGSGQTLLISAKTEKLISKPSSLVLKFSNTTLAKLYWANVGTGSIQSYDLQTKQVDTIWNDNENAKKLVLSPYALCLKGDSLIFSSQKYPSLYQLTGGDPELKELSLLRNQSEVITALKIYDQDLQYGSNQCAVSNGGCAHLCLPVSSAKRKCKCAIGFETDPNDETRCLGAREFLLYSWNLGLKGVALEQTSKNKTVSNARPVLPPISKVLMASHIDFSFRDSYIYLVDSDDGSIIRIKHDTTGYQKIIKNVDNLEGIAVDWSSGLIYWIESTYEIIEMARMNGSYRYVLVSNISKPTSLALDPNEAFLFYSTVNESSVQIFRSRLDGSEQRAILNETSSKLYINKLTVDLVEKQIYWCDSKGQVIERANYDGTNRTVVYKNAYYLKNPVSISVHKEFVYFADTHFESGSILKVDKRNVTDQLRNATIVTEKMGDHIKDLKVFYEQPINPSNPCTKQNGGCSELCLFLGGTRHRCICSHGKLSANNRTCEPYDAFIMFSRIVDIDSIHVSDENIQNSPYPLISNKTYMQNVIGLTFSYKDRKIIYSDIQKGSINSMNFNGTDHRILVDKQGAVEGIAFDPLNDEIYWTSNSDASINRFRIKGPPRGNRSAVEKIIRLTNQDKPRGIAIDSCRSMIYWTNWNLARPSIQRSYLSGNGNVIQSIITTDIRMPNAIALDFPTSRLYWSDARLDKIERCNYDGSSCLVVISEVPQHPFAITLYGDWLFWSDWVCPYGDRYGKGCVYRVNKFNGQDLKLLKRKVPRPMGIVAVANDTADCSLNPCLKMNGGCQERCNVADNGTIVCSCFPGKELAADLRACEPVKEVANVTCDGYLCKQSKKCIPQQFVCDAQPNDCGPDDNSDELDQICKKKECSKDEFKCVKTGICISKAHVCDGEPDCGLNDSSDELNCNATLPECKPDTEFRCANGICLRIEWYCDGDDDCLDLSDEPYNCKPHQIAEHPALDNRNKTDNCLTGDCVKNNKCNQTARVCSQWCVNTDDGHRCSCAPDYRAVDNGTSCVVDSEIKPLLLFSNRFVIRQTNLMGGDLTQRISHLTNAVALDYDYQQGCLYWSNITPLGSHIKRACSKNDTQGNQQKETIHSSTVQSPDGLAVDWISENLYWCDKMKDTIEVSKLNGLYRKVLIRENLQEPRAIVVSPADGILFWTDWGDHAYIGRANMDGTNQRVIVNDSLAWPNALAIDYVTREIFYGDAKLDYIAVCDYDGKRRQVIIDKRNSRTINHVFALSVFEDYIYYSDWESKSISKCHKYRCENTTKLLDVFHRPMDIQVYHPFRQKPLEQANPCDKLNCQTLCLLKAENQTGKLSATCACPENFVLNADQRTCSANCTSVQFICKNTFKCIPKLWKCDGQPDCALSLPSEDEPSDCRPFFCIPGQFQCENRECLDPKKICNGSPDCSDKSDEIDCPAKSLCEPPGTCANETSCAPDHTYCKQGYCVGNKWLCEQPYSCLDKEFCYNAGVCYMDKIVENNHTYSRPRCECKSRYQGTRCQQCVKPDDTLMSCENGGWCTYPVNYTTQPECKCAAGYLGSHCQKSLCMNYCSNDGLCRLVGGIPKCECRNGYVGKTCAQDTCNGFCLNNGICVREDDKRKCVCSSSFAGKRCETNRCNCLNGGYCSGANTPGSICVCPANFMGRHCERFVASSCKTVDCSNGGVCKINEHDQLAYCDCPKEYKGVFCDLPVTNGTLDCANSYHCLNGGECAVVNRALTCSCPDGKFSGSRCEIVLSASNKTDAQSTGSKKLFYVLLAVSLFFVCLFIFVFGFSFKAYKRSRHFAHRRMDESITHGNLEIRNPIFDGDLTDDSVTGLNAYGLDGEDEKLSNFDNPVYCNSYNSSPRTDESRNLLIDDRSSLSRNSDDKLHPLA